MIDTEIITELVLLLSRLKSCRDDSKKIVNYNTFANYPEETGILAG
jgi:hypothetical protein